jgi:hypothetical protein
MLSKFMDILSKHPPKYLFFFTATVIATDSGIDAGIWFAPTPALQMLVAPAM